MKASDTVMESIPFLLLSDLFPINSEDKVRELYSRMDRMREMAAKAQAEISFKAGIQEVVELLKLYNPIVGSDEGTNCYMLDIPFWQSKLKEWGIE